MVWRGSGVQAEVDGGVGVKRNLCSAERWGKGESIPLDYQAPRWVQISTRGGSVCQADPRGGVVHAKLVESPRRGHPHRPEREVGREKAPPTFEMR